MDESLRDITHTRPPLSAWLGIVLLFFLFGAIVLAVIGPASRSDNYEQTRAKKRAENLTTLREEGTKALTTYAWADKAKGTVHIPIDRAIELSIADLSSKKVTSAGPIATPAPAQPAQPAPSPAAAGKPAAPSASPASGGGAQPAASPVSTPAAHPSAAPLPSRGGSPKAT